MTLELSDIENEINDTDLNDNEINDTDTNDNDTNDVIESTLYLMEDYLIHNPKSISEPNFKELLFDEIN